MFPGNSSVRTLLAGFVLAALGSLSMFPGAAIAPGTTPAAREDPGADRTLVERARVAGASPETAALGELRFSLNRGQEGLPPGEGATIAEARRLIRNGEYAAAGTLAESLANDASPTVRAAARLALGEALLLDGRPVRAAEVLGDLAREHPQDPLPAFFLARAQQASGDCASADAAYRRYLALDATVEPYVRLLLADCALARDDPATALAESDAALRLAGLRILQVEALERRASAHERLGEDAAALADYERLLELATLRTYRAELLWKLAELNRRTERLSAAAQRYRAVVVEVPESPQARDALAALADLGAEGTVSLYQAGLVYYHARQYQPALAAFQAYLDLDGGSDAPGAWYYRALARRQLGEDAGAAEDLAELADRFPSAQLAPDALFRSGQILEELGQTEVAAARYRALAERYPASARALEGQYRLGQLQYQKGDLEAALAVWRRLAEAEPAGERARALLWIGKAYERLGEPGEAAVAWRAAAEAQPDGYFGLRARELAGDRELAATPTTLDASALPPNEADDRELVEWIAGQGASVAGIAAELSDDEGFRRADLLVRLQLRREARWELDSLASRLAGDPARLAVLADAERDRGLHDAAHWAALQAVRAAGLSPLAAPRALQKLIYPIPYPSALQPVAEKHGLDPRLLAALVMQESRFDPNARSRAGALGLSQVMPATGRDIARALGDASFEPEQLLRPRTSLEYGGAFLAAQLRRFGAVAPALAAYNGGPGNANRWVAAAGATDPDLLGESVDIGETQSYLRIVWANYALYRLIYPN